MKLLVTGGDGFIGRNYIESYEEGHLLSAPTIKQLNCADAASVQKYFAKDYFDVVLHLADNVYKQNGFDVSDGLVMFRNVQYSSIINRVFRIVYVGDGTEYGEQDLINVTEEQWGEEIPREPFGITKYLVNSLVQKDKLTINLRHFMVYGRYASPYSNVISAMAYHAAKNKDIILTRDRTVSIIYIEDSLKVIDAAVNGAFPKGDYNVVAQSVKLSQIARQLKRISGGTFNIKILKRKPDPEYTASNAKLLEIMPSLKFTKLSKGLKELYDWMKRAQGSFNEKKIVLP